MNHCSTLIASAALFAFAAQAQEPGDDGRGRNDQQTQWSHDRQSSSSSRVLASRLMDRDIRTQDQSEVTIEDMVFDPANSKIAFLLVTDGSGDDYHAIPIDKLEIRKRGSEDELVVRMNGTDLEKCPSISEDDYDRATTREFAKKVESGSKFDSSSGSASATAGRNRAGSGNDTWGSERSGDSPWSRTSGTTDQQSKLVFVSDLMDRSILASNRDDQIGDIENVAVDTSTGRVPFVVVGTGGFLGMGETLRAVPTSKLDFRRSGDEREIIANLNERDVSDLPRFARDRIDSIEAGGRDASGRGDSAMSGGGSEDAWIVQVWEIYTVPVSTGPQVVETSTRLPLDIPNDRKVTFVLDVNLFENQLGSDRSPQEEDSVYARPEGEIAPNRQRDGRSGQQQSADTASSRKSGSANASNRIPRRAVYELSSVQDQGDGSRKIDVKVTWFGGWSGQQDSSGMGSSEWRRTDGTDEKSGFGDTERAERGSRGGQTGQTGQPGRDTAGGAATQQGGRSMQTGAEAKSKHFTVTLEPDGSVSDIDTRNDASGKSWSDREESRGDARMPLRANRVRGHIELLVGAGLHSKQLEPGEAYACSSQEQGDRAFCLEYVGRTATAGDSDMQNDSGDRAGRDSPAGGSGEQTATGQNRGDRARATATAPDSSGSKSGFAKFSIRSPHREGNGDRGYRNDAYRPGSQRDEQSGMQQSDMEGSSMQSSDRGGNPGLGKAGWAGTALYSLEDGLLEALIARHVKSGETCTVSVVRSQPNSGSGDGAASDRAGNGQGQARTGGRRR